MIYLYIGNFDRPIKEREICFSDRFEVCYHKDTRHLNICKKEGGMAGLYGKAVKRLDLIVGKNGTGKTTILEILGLPKQQRMNVIPIRNGWNREEDRYPWFVLYHIGGDQFALEGHWCDTLDFLSGEEYTYLQPLYSIAFHYDFSAQRAVGRVEVLQDVPALDGKRRINDELFYILYRTEPESAWCKQPYPLKGEDMNIDVICQRIHAGHNGYAGITRYLFESVHNDGFSRQVESSPGGTIRIKVRRGDKSQFAQAKSGKRYEREEQGKRVAEKLIYDTRGAFLEPFDDELEACFPQSGRKRLFSKRETLVLLYLQELACYVCLEYLDTAPEVDEGEPEICTGGPFLDYEKWKELLLCIVERHDETDRAIAELIVKGLETIPEKYFVRDTEIRIRLKDMEENFLHPFMDGMDKNQQVPEHDIDHRYFLPVEFSGLSTGEAQYLDLYAALSQALKDCGHEVGDTCVLLLDEPDSRFHPEWSRQFIRNLTRLLNGEEFNRYRYQVILCTHSPLLVSDVPRQWIHCLKRDPDTGMVEIRESQYGFMSSLDDILMDSFYTDSIFGAFAEEYVNRIIEGLKWAEDRVKDGEYNAFEMKERLSCLEQEIKLIDDGLIRRSLRQRLERSRARIERGKGHDPDLS